MYVIKAIYPQGSHVVTEGGERLRFANEQTARDKAEWLLSAIKSNCLAMQIPNQVSYIVTEEGI